MSSAEKYGEGYFNDRYLGRSRVLRRYRGDRVFAYSFWERYLQRRIGEHASVLEVGCGTGFLLSRLNRTYRAFGVDLSWVALSGCAVRTSSASLALASGEALPFEDKSFAVVAAFDVLEHLSDPASLVHEANRVLAEGGLFVATTPNLASLGARLKGRRMDLDGRPYEERRLQSFMWRDEGHIGLRSRAEWLDILLRAGLLVVRSGTDCLWDLPYSARVPMAVQKALLVPLNSVFQLLVGFLPWRLGENLVIVAQKAGRSG